jgi:hypothetical protein
MTSGCSGWTAGALRGRARDNVRIASAEVHRGEAAVIAETLRRLRGGFVIGQFGGLVVPDEGNLRPLALALECPLFLVR